MRILCSVPGRFGDILWALPTIRLISEKFGVPVDFMTSTKYGDESFLKLIEQQEYINRALKDPLWEICETAPITPRVPPRVDELSIYDKIFHLGYHGWPQAPTLAQEFYDIASIETELAPLDLERPWISVPTTYDFGPHVFVGWNQQWIEMKMGITLSLGKRLLQAQFDIVYPPGFRHDEWRQFDCKQFMFSGIETWQTMANAMADDSLYFGDLSGLWVLANAMGKRCVVMEPDRDRWNPVFWLNSPRNTLVRGNDGLPTFDARHCGDAIAEALAKAKA